MTAEPADRFYESQGLRLHYADWGNEAAPPLILIHGGLDHCRSWDAIAQALQPHFHIMAPDLRGHGDSEWAKGSSYSISDHVYDLSCLIRFAELQDATIVGHSLGGMISLTYAGTYPSRVSRLAVLDGAFLPGSRPAPMHEQMSRWIDQLDRIAEHVQSAFRTIEEAAQRLSARNKRLTPAQALHLARHGSHRGRCPSCRRHPFPRRSHLKPACIFARGNHCLWRRDASGFGHDRGIRWCLRPPARAIAVRSGAGNDR